jgi:hypothetical protein
MGRQGMSIKVDVESSNLSMDAGDELPSVPGLGVVSNTAIKTC